MTSSKVLVVEDDQTLLDVIQYNLSNEKYEVVTASDGVKALEIARTESPDLVILDVMLPRLDGFEVCRILRSEATLSILMLTARTEEVDRVVGLEIGADDYVTKPFSMRELMARVKALLRRTDMKAHGPRHSNEDMTLSIISEGDIRVDVARHQVFVRGSATELSPREFDLLAFLAANPGRVFSRDELLEKLWGYDYIGDTRTVDVHIRWLRKKIEEQPARPRHLVTVRGVGYKFEV